MTNTKFSNTPSILVIGATGRTGLETIHHLAKHRARPAIHAFCRDPSKFTEEDLQLCHSVITGCARNEEDIKHALAATNANWILISIGNGESVDKTDIRTASAEATVKVLENPSFTHVRVAVVSCIGAGPSKIVVGMGIGLLITYHIRHVLVDHTGQEAAFAKIANRAILVRATDLTKDQATGKLVTFGDQERCPTIKTDRTDLAAWIVKQICDVDSNGGVVVNVTSVK